MKKGRQFEKFVQLIQESFKDSPSTEIYSNYKLETIKGRKREFDVFIKSSLNNYEINIAIECKDQKRPISVDKIEAFHSKCQRFKGISKKVFVTSGEYQADSIDAAKEFDIELYHLSEISQKIVVSWISLVLLKPVYKLKAPYNIGINDSEDKLTGINLEEDPLMYYYDTSEKPIRMTFFLWDNIIVERQKEIQSCMIFDFIRNKNIHKSLITTIPFKMPVKGLYLLNSEGRKLKISQIDAEVICWFDEVNVKFDDARKYQNHTTKNVEASLISFEIGSGNKYELVFTSNNEFSAFYTSEDNEQKKLKLLLTYDPRTDKFEYPE
jgi:hypothetical protein